MSAYPNNNKSRTSRREFILKGSMASLGVFVAGSGGWSNPLLSMTFPDSKISGVQMGVITYSYRSLPGTIQQILKYVTDSGIGAIELMGDAVEDYAGKPANPVKMPPFVAGQRPQLTDEQRAQLAEYQKQVAAWRASVPMDKFAEVKKMFKKAGVSIYAFKPNALGPNNSDAEISYAMRAAKTLGAKSVTIEVPTDAAHSKRLGELGEKHKMYIGYHNHTQATDTLWDTLLSQSPYNTINLDCGHYIAAGGNNTKETLLAFIEKHNARITSMHIKDRKTKENGAANLPWGQGDTPIKEILNLLRVKKYKIPATIELEYQIPAGSDAVTEVRKCLDYAKSVLA